MNGQTPASFVGAALFLALILAMSSGSQINELTEYRVILTDRNEAQKYKNEGQVVVNQNDPIGL